MTVTSPALVGTAAHAGSRLRSVAASGRGAADRAVFRQRRIVLGIVLAGFAAISLSGLAVHLAMVDGVYKLAALQAQARDLAVTREIMSARVNELASMDRLTLNAQRLGMIVSSNPVYLRLSDGAVLGSPDAVRRASLGEGALPPGFTVTPR